MWKQHILSFLYVQIITKIHFIIKMKIFHKVKSNEKLFCWHFYILMKNKHFTGLIPCLVTKTWHSFFLNIELKGDRMKKIIFCENTHNTYKIILHDFLPSPKSGQYDYVLDLRKKNGVSAKSPDTLLVYMTTNFFIQSTLSSIFQNKNCVSFC